MVYRVPYEEDRRVVAERRVPTRFQVVVAWLTLRLWPTRWAMDILVSASDRKKEHT